MCRTSIRASLTKVRSSLRWDMTNCLLCVRTGAKLTFARKHRSPPLTAQDVAVEYHELYWAYVPHEYLVATPEYEQFPHASYGRTPREMDQLSPARQQPALSDRLP